MVTYAPTRSYSYQSQAKTLAQAPIPQADLDRKEQMLEAWKSYRGDFPKPLKVSANQPDDNVIVNRCAPIVNKGVSFLFSSVLKITAAEQDFIDELLGDDDEKMTLLANQGINGGVCGQNFVKLIPAIIEGDAPRIVVMNPQIIRIVTLPDDCTQHIAYVIEYPGPGDSQKRQIIARIDPNNDLEQVGENDLQDTWNITNYIRRMSSDPWVQVGTPDYWLYPFAPIQCNQNLPNPNEPWGISDITPDIIGMNRSLNFNQTNTSRIIKYHAHPLTYVIGMQASQLQVAIDDILCLPSENSKVGSLEMHSDLASSRAFGADLRSDMDEQSRVPAVALGRLESLPKGNISGVALQLLFQPLTEKTIQKRRLYGSQIRDTTRAAMVLAGKLSIAEYKKYKVNLGWEDLLPVDDLAAAQTGQILVGPIGISKATVQQKLGFNPEDEAKQKAKEDAAALAAMPPGTQPMQPGQPQVKPAPQGGQF